jgi:glutathione-specific gamma-glutamylcyclotransferase
MQDDSGGVRAPSRPVYYLTRERLRDGSHLARIRARALPGFPIRSDEEIAASLKEALVGRPKDCDVWVFGYGSLIWNPAFDFAQRRVALVRGWASAILLMAEGRTWHAGATGPDARSRSGRVLSRGCFPPRRTSDRRGIAHPLAARDLTDDQISDRIAIAHGPLGSCAEYLLNTVEHLEELGFRDASLERIRRRVERRQRAAKALAAQ